MRAIAFGVLALSGGLAVLMHQKRQSYREQGQEAWQRFNAWVQAGMPDNHRYGPQSVADLDHLLFLLERAGMRSEQTAVAMLYEKIGALIQQRRPPR